MNPVRIVILAVAAVAAIAVALLLRNVASKPKAAPAPMVMTAPKPTTRVLVAARDLPIGTRLSPQDMSWQPWPADALNPSWISDGVKTEPKPQGAAGAASEAATAAKDVVTGGGPAMQALVGAIVRSDMAKGEPIVAGKIVRGGDGGYMSVVLKPGMRAIAIPVNTETGVGGFIQPGDRVDLLQSYADNNRKGGPGFVSRAVVSNVRVLAVDQTTDPPKNGKSSVAATITLEIPAETADQVVEAKVRGGLMLALRSYADMSGGPSNGAASGVDGVRVFKGSSFNQVTVSR
ncbi:MAG TPA: Flp pilus assembly protein CpaB [Caulobacteraceae bacterium]|nr:Flp pilus assembly protein CpaB [Caulobacteraceae bacterium]